MAAPSRSISAAQARDLDLRNLPRDLKVPPAATDVNADYHVRSVPWRAASGGPHTRVRLSRPIADARFAVDGRRRADRRTAAPPASTCAGSDLAYRADATVDGISICSGSVQAFNVPALAADRYRAHQRASRRERPRHDARGHGRQGQRHVDRLRRSWAAAFRSSTFDATRRERLSARERRTARSRTSIRRSRAASRE